MSDRSIEGQSSQAATSERQLMEEIAMLFSGNQKNYTDIEEDIFDQSDYSTPGWERAKIETSNKNLENFEPKIISNSQAKYSKGSIVIHKKFGQGRVESIDGKKLTINFGESGTRKVMENFVESLN